MGNNNTRQRWSNADISELKRRRANGEKPVQIAISMKRKKSAVYGKLASIEGRTKEHTLSSTKINMGKTESKNAQIDAVALMAAIPVDNRTLSQVICGEPLTGRGAGNGGEPVAPIEISPTGIQYYSKKYTIPHRNGTIDDERIMVVKLPYIPVPGFGRRASL